jgi:hypothetical protein
LSFSDFLGGFIGNFRTHQLFEGRFIKVFSLHRYFGSNKRVRVIIEQLEIFVLKAEDVFNPGLDKHF